MKALRQIIISLVIAGLPLLSVPFAHAASPNLIANASVETVDPGSSSAPQGWYSDSWGSNSSSFSYASTGHSGNRSVRVDTSGYIDGDAKWLFDPVAVSPNTKYTFTDWYKSSIYTDVLAQFRSTTGSYSYKWLTYGNASATNWQQVTSTFTTPANVQSMTILHLLADDGWLQTDDFSLTAYQTPTAPTVNVTAPTAGSTITGSSNLAATASDAIGLAGVQFMVDGNNVGAEDTSAPYQVAWDSSTVANGAHQISAVARNTSGLSTASAPVSVNVQNVVTPPPSGDSIIPNASAETAVSGQPQGWAGSKSKTNNAAFNYLGTGHTGSHSLQIKITSYTSGDAFWAYPMQSVQGGKTYEFSDWYQSTVPTNVYGDVIMQDGSEQWINIGLTAVASPGWNKFYTQFTMPANAKSIVVYHSLDAVGTLTTDDYQLNPFTPTGFNRGLVSLTFDDGLRSIYTYGLPVLNKYGFKSTQFLLSGTTNDSYYMTGAMMKTFAQQGHEIASHSVTHPHLTTLGATKLNNELKNSQTRLLTLTGVKPTNFASPYGELNSTTLTKIKTYYSSQRGVETGFNAKNNFDIWDIKVQDVVATTSVADVTAWVDQALAQHTWLVLVYHATDPSTSIPDANWNTTPTQLDAQFLAIKNSGITVETLNQALNEIKPQL